MSPDVMSETAPDAPGSGGDRSRPLPGQASEASMSLQAWIRPWTDSTDFLNIAFSSSLVENSMTFSTPFAPIRAGTPT